MEQTLLLVPFMYREKYKDSSNISELFSNETINVFLKWNYKLISPYKNWLDKKLKTGQKYIFLLTDGKKYHYNGKF